MIASTARRCAVTAAMVFLFLMTAANAGTVAQWRRDLDQMYANLKQYHPDPFHEVGKIAFQRNLESLKAELPTLSDEQRVVKAMRMMASLADRSTGVEPRSADFADWYPIRVTEFADGYFVTSAHKSQADLAGAQVLQIAGRRIADVADDARSLLSSENRFSRKERLYALHNAALMKGLGYAANDGSLKFKFKLGNGNVIERVLKPHHTDNPIFDKDDSSFAWADFTETYGLPFGTFDDWIAAFGRKPSSAFRTPDASRPLFMAYRRVFYARAIPEEDAYYAQVNAVSDSKDETYIAFFQRFLKEVDQQKPRRLILDFRYNFGGDGSKATAMIHEFIKREDNPPWKQLYILTSGRTGGAAMSVISAFLQNVHVSLVGEPTGVALNFTSDAKEFSFPQIGMYQTVGFLRAQLGESDDTVDNLPVSVPAPMAFAEYMAGQDAAVDPILAGVDMRSLPVIALSDGGPAARKAYEARKQLSTRYPWWNGERFIDMKRTGYELLRTNHPADSVEVFKINTERFPDDWMSWENLGRGQTGAGKLEDARQSYQCAMILDPQNFDRGDMLSAIEEAGGNKMINVAPGCPLERSP